MKFVSIKKQLSPELFATLVEEGDDTTEYNYFTLIKIGKAVVLSFMAVLGLMIIATAAFGIIVFSFMISAAIFGTNSDSTLVAARILMSIGFLVLASVVIGFFYEGFKK